jgi:hypothetical protein
MAISDKVMKDVQGLKEVDLDVNNHEEFELFDSSDDAFHDKDLDVGDWVENHNKTFDGINEDFFNIFDA